MHARHISRSWEFCQLAGEIYSAVMLLECKNHMKLYAKMQKQFSEIIILNEYYTIYEYIYRCMEMNETACVKTHEVKKMEHYRHQFVSLLFERSVIRLHKHVWYNTYIVIPMIWSTMWATASCTHSYRRYLVLIYIFCIYIYNLCK